MAGDVQAVVFDLDGVLVDSEELWAVVRRGVAAEAGRPWPTGATRAMQGMSTAEWSAYLTDAVGVAAEPAEVAATVVDRMAAQYDARLPLLAGAVEVVERLARRWPLGLASSSPRRLIDTVLESAGLAQRFQVSVSTEEVGAGTPWRHQTAGAGGEVRADQLLLAGVVAIGVGWLGVSKPAASTASYVGEKGSFGASCYVGPGITQSAVSVAASDVAAVGVCHVISPNADAPHTGDHDDHGEERATTGPRMGYPQGSMGYPHSSGEGTRQ